MYLKLRRSRKKPKKLIAYKLYKDFKRGYHPKYSFFPFNNNITKLWQCEHQANLLQQVELLKTATRNKLNINYCNLYYIVSPKSLNNHIA